jgi:hypothetical protein
MSKTIIKLLFLIILFAFPSAINANVDSTFHCYLLFGQSNMAGGCNGSTAKPESIDRKDTDCDTTTRVKVLAYTNCSNAQSYPCGTFKQKRVYNEWYTAFPPYHSCSEGIGPADYFGKTLLDSIRGDISIGFIPCAISGVDIDFFRKGIVSSRRGEFYIPPDNRRSGAYEWMLERCKLAQKSGVIKGILFHQGESDNNSPQWVGKVKEIVNDLRTDLGLGEGVPFLAGELLRTGACASHNNQVAKIKDSIPNAYVVTSENLVVRAGDSWNLHFSCESTRTFGKRYAQMFLKNVNNSFVPRKGSPMETIHERTTVVSRTISKSALIYSLNGKVVKSVESFSNNEVPIEGVYIVVDKVLDNGRLRLTPFISRQ